MISEIGEFKLINLIAGMVKSARDEGAASWQNLLIGIGDDCAAWHGNTSTQLAKVDCLVQDVHFSLDIISWEDLGWKALAINLSDIAAMGGYPKYAMVSLGLPAKTQVEDVTALYRGILSLAKSSGVALAGGNMSRSSKVFIDVTVLGETSHRNGTMLTRSAAVPGDLIAVTGYTGTAAAGFRMLSRKLKFDTETSAVLRSAFVHPIPRIEEGRLLIKLGVKAAIDISDGLVADLRHICESSQVSARLEVERVPVHPTVKACFADKSLELALSGGEDYELLFTAKESVIERVKKSTDCPVTVIGEIISGEPGKVNPVDSRGKPFKLVKAGWDHFGK